MIHRSTEADRNRVIDTLVLGLSRDPILRWYFPEPHDFLANAPALLNLIGGRAFEHGSAYHTDDFICCALWLPPDVHPDIEGITGFLEQKLDGALLEDAAALEAQMDGFQPEEPCWHLTTIAADPARTGKGYGSRMLEHTLAVCDEDGKVAYLESTNPANFTLYQRYGFELIGEIQTGSSPTVYPMRREPG